MPTIPRLKDRTKSRTKDPNQLIDRRNRKKIYNDKRWIILRGQHIQREPLCQVCRMEGRVTLAEEVHHVTPFPLGRTDAERKALAFDSANLISLCKKCHWRCHHEDLQGTRTREDIENRIKSQGKYKPIAE